jgi:HJR/Mrr/RecB family endonuclease
LGAAALYQKGLLAHPEGLLILAVGVGAAVVGVLVLFAIVRRAIRPKSKQLDGLSFERYIAGLLPRLGFTDVRLTERYDLGVDIVARKDGITWGIQVKHYGGLVKVDAVRQVVTALNMYGCDRAMVVTNSDFSWPAIELARSNDCVLVDGRELLSWTAGAGRV